MEYTTEFVSDYDTAVTIGKFDGFHIGHLELINRIKEYADVHGLRTAVVSFNPYPAETFGRPGEQRAILTTDEKINVLEALGIDLYIEHPFTKEFAGMSADVFLHEKLFKGLRCKYIAVGEGYRFGRKREGTSELLVKEADKRGVSVEIVKKIMFNGDEISSSLVRRRILECDFETAKEIMYKPYFVSGVVAHGRKIGRTIGIPTVNIIPVKTKLLPPDAVYFTKVLFKGEYINSITNIGTNPTISPLGSRTVESHMLDCDIAAYGENIEIVFVKKIRDIVKFDNISELCKQIEYDISIVRGLI